MKKMNQDLMDFLGKSPTSYQLVSNLAMELEKRDFIKLSKDVPWDVKEGEKYYFSQKDGAIVAFIMGSTKVEEFSFHIIGSHGDSPGFRIKPNSEMKAGKSYVKLNTEVYGGPIYSTWYDRPLTIAGQVSFSKNGRVESENIYVDKDLLIIPNLAIHMNREVNSGYKFNPQKDTLPLLGMVEEKLETDGYLLEVLSEFCNVKKEEILDFDLFLCPREKGTFVGAKEEFISSPRLDDGSMAYLSMRALWESKPSKATKMVVVFDHEEIGSHTIAGAQGAFFRDGLERIALSVGHREAYYLGMERGYMISADLTHAFHPNYEEAADPTNRPILNKGPVIKMAANGSYSTTGKTSAIFQELCKGAEVPYQFFTNRSDKRGGSTIGPIALEKLNIDMVDVGTPCLSMHSIRELVGSDDQKSMYKVFLEFFHKKRDRL